MAKFKNFKIFKKPDNLKKFNSHLKSKKYQNLNLIAYDEPSKIISDTLEVDSLSLSARKKSIHISQLARKTRSDTEFYSITYLYGAKFLRKLSLKKYRIKYKNRKPKTPLNYKSDKIFLKLKELKLIRKKLKKFLHSVNSKKKFKLTKKYLRLRIIKINAAIKILYKEIADLSPDEFNEIIPARLFTMYGGGVNKDKDLATDFLVKSKGSEGSFSFPDHSYTKNINNYIFNKQSNIYSSIKQLAGGLLRLDNYGNFKNHGEEKTISVMKLNNKSFSLSFNSLNKTVDKYLFNFFYSILKFFRRNLFPRNELFLYDMCAMLALLARRELNINMFVKALATILNSIHKNKHRFLLKMLGNIIKKSLLSRNSLIAGMKVKVSGRISGNSIASSVVIYAGSCELNTINAETDYAFVHAYTVYGVYGIKFWITYRHESSQGQLSDNLKFSKFFELLKVVDQMKTKKKEHINGKVIINVEDKLVPTLGLRCVRPVIQKDIQRPSTTLGKLNLKYNKAIKDRTEVQPILDKLFSILRKNLVNTNSPIKTIPKIIALDTLAANQIIKLDSRFHPRIETASTDLEPIYDRKIKIDSDDNLNKVLEVEKNFRLNQLKASMKYLPGRQYSLSKPQAVVSQPKQVSEQNVLDQFQIYFSELKNKIKDNINFKKTLALSKPNKETNKNPQQKKKHAISTKKL